MNQGIADVNKVGKHYAPPPPTFQKWGGGGSWEAATPATTPPCEYRRVDYCTFNVIKIGVHTVQPHGKELVLVL